MTEPSIRQYYLNWRPDMARFLPSSFSTTLEIGCGAGDFTDVYLRSATERWGVEPNARAAAAAEPKFSKLITGAYDEISSKIPANYFDLVVCNDVIEHMPDHDAFLEDIAQKIKPGGYIVGSVPNIRHFTALVKILLMKDFPYADDGILDRTHKRFFTMKSLRRAFTEHGYRIEALEGNRSIVLYGVTGLSPAWTQISRVAAVTVIVFSLGWWADTQYPQIAFRVVRP